MTEVRYVAPGWGSSSFNCVRCGALAQQDWQSVGMSPGKQDFQTGGEKPAVRVSAGLFASPKTEKVWEDVAVLGSSNCFACKKATLWLEGKIIWPGQMTGPACSQDMPLDVRKLYEEARGIADRSPRAAAALLRLAADKLAIHVGGTGRDFYARLESLSKLGLPERALRAMNGIRKGGREAVHPGEINLDDKPELVHQMFKFLNLAVDYLITKPKELADFDEAIPN